MEFWEAYPVTFALIVFGVFLTAALLADELRRRR